MSTKATRHHQIQLRIKKFRKKGTRKSKQRWEELTVIQLIWLEQLWNSCGISFGVKVDSSRNSARLSEMVLSAQLRSLTATGNRHDTAFYSQFKRSEKTISLARGARYEVIYVNLKTEFLWQHSTEQHSTAKQSKAQHSSAQQCSAVQYGAFPCSAVQYRLFSHS